MILTNEDIKIFQKTYFRGNYFVYKRIHGFTSFMSASAACA